MTTTQEEPSGDSQPKGLDVLALEPQQLVEQLEDHLSRAIEAKADILNDEPTFERYKPGVFFQITDRTVSDSDALQKLDLLLQRGEELNVLEYKKTPVYPSPLGEPGGQPVPRSKYEIRYLTSDTQEYVQYLIRERIAGVMEEPDVSVESSPYNPLNDEKHEDVDTGSAVRQHEVMMDDSEYVKAFEDECLYFLMTNPDTKFYFDWHYSGKRTADGRLFSKDGHQTDSTPSSYVDFLITGPTGRGKRVMTEDQLNLIKHMSVTKYIRAHQEQ